MSSKPARFRTRSHAGSSVVSKPYPREATAQEIVIPAKAGIQAGWSGETPRRDPAQDPWIPAFAGMTEGGGNDGLDFRAR